jgi:crotonobetainyl-CoA:carnitine CoA-transferase CaiB-like acyl-CoA transferase
VTDVTGPLQGVRILDLSWVGVGCIATWTLAELGAEVIKIEPPDGSDNLRTLAPKVHGHGVNHLVFDRHKKSLPVNLRTPEGREAYLAVAKTADAEVEGMRTGVADRLGIGAAALREVNPRLTYVTLPGYGSGGPLSSVAGHDINFDAIAGVLSMTWPGPVGPPPVQPGDYFGAALAALAVVSGVLQGRSCGSGVQAESSLFDGAMFSTVIPQAHALMMGADVRPESYPLIGAFACYGTYASADGQLLAIGPLEPHFWKRFCELAEIDDDGAQYDPQRQDELRQKISEALSRRTREEWIAHFGTEDVCVSPVLTLSEAIHHPHVRERNGISKVLHPDGQVLEAPGPPLRIAGRDLSQVASVPALGEGARELLLEAGLSKDRVDELTAAGFVYAPPASDS